MFHLQTRNPKDKTVFSKLNRARKRSHNDRAARAQRDTLVSFLCASRQDVAIVDWDDESLHN